MKLPSTRTRFLLAILIAGSLATSACGAVTPESQAFVANDSEQTVIRFATPRIEGFEAAIADWEREHPTVEVQVVTSEPDEHHEWLVEGSTPPPDIDVIAFDGAHSATARARAEVFVDMSEHIDDDFGQDFLANRWAEGVADDGTLVGVPVDTDIALLFVRRDMATAALLNELRGAQGWCDVISAGNSFVELTDKAFLADGEELLRAVLTQNRESWVEDDGRIDPATLLELQRAWNIALLGVGAPIVGINPCEGLVDPQPILRDLTPGEAVWQTELASDDFGAVISNWSTRSRIPQAYPESVDLWATIELPVDRSFSTTTGSSSEGGLHLAVPATGTNVDIAVDFVLTLTNPAVQASTFLSGNGPLPAASTPFEDGIVDAAEDSFFSGSPVIGTVASNTVRDRPTLLATPERQLVINELVEALAVVQSQLQTPAQAWATALDNIETLVSGIDSAR